MDQSSDRLNGNLKAVLNIISVFRMKAASAPTPTFQGILIISLLMKTQEVFVDSIDQDQTVQNVKSDL